VLTGRSSRPSMPAAFENDGKHLTVRLDEPLAEGEDLTIYVDYSLNEPKAGLHFFAPTDDDPDAPYLMWSQGQSIDTRYWVPCFDHPNERQVTEISCTVAQPYQVISNGRLIKIEENNDNT